MLDRPAPSQPMRKMRRGFRSDGMDDEGTTAFSPALGLAALLALSSILFAGTLTAFCGTFSTILACLALILGAFFGWASGSFEGVLSLTALALVTTLFLGEALVGEMGVLGDVGEGGVAGAAGEGEPTRGEVILIEKGLSARGVVMPCKMRRGGGDETGTDRNSLNKTWCN